MIIDEEAYLEHFGVKGMQWGVRKSVHNFRVTQKRRNLNKYGDKNVKPLTAAQKRARKERLADRVVLGARVAVGAAIVGTILLSRAHEKASETRFQDAFDQERFKDSFRNARRGGFGGGTGGTGRARAAASAARGERSVRDIINSERASQAASLLRMHQEGKMDARQHAAFLKKLNARYDRKISGLG